MDELILKNVQKNLISLKVQADLAIFKNIIKFSALISSFSLLIYFRPFNLNTSIYLTAFYYVPYLILSSFLEYKDSYLKYANNLAKSIIYLLGVYIFTCGITFLLLIQVKLSNLAPFTHIHSFVFFIPVFGVNFIITLFCAFLYHGYKTDNKLKVFYSILFLLLNVNLITSLSFLKIAFAFENLNWFDLLGYCALLHGAYVVKFISSSGISKPGSENEFTPKSSDDVITVLNVLLHFSSVCIYLLLGLYLDNSLDGNKLNTLFSLVWLFCLILIIKCIYSIQKIETYFEWKKMAYV